MNQYLQNNPVCDADANRPVSNVKPPAASNALAAGPSINQTNAAQTTNAVSLTPSTIITNYPSSSVY